MAQEYARTKRHDYCKINFIDDINSGQDSGYVIQYMQIQLQTTARQQHFKQNLIKPYPSNNNKM